MPVSVLVNFKADDPCDGAAEEDDAGLETGRDVTIRPDSLSLF